MQAEAKCYRNVTYTIRKEFVWTNHMNRYYISDPTNFGFMNNVAENISFRLNTHKHALEMK